MTKISPADAEKELKELKKLACSTDFGGWEDFRKERSHILNLAYICLRSSNKTFSECQRDAWEKYRAVQDCNLEELYE